MGILGFQKLQTEEVVGGINKIQIIDKICEWKIAHPEQQPIVVVRLKELMMSVIQLNVKAAFFGGSHRYYHQKLDEFLRPLRDANVKLVFFGGGATTKDKLAKMTMKYDQTYKKCNQLLKHIDKTNEVKLCARPELRTCLGLYEEGIARQYGEYVLATGSLNKEIVLYCQANENVVAVLAKDSDFLIYDLKHVEYWSCGIEDLNFNEMTTISFNHTALLDHLNLTPYQFQCMVTIAGVILDDAKTHCWRVKKDILTAKSAGSISIIRSISDFVRKNLPEVDGKAKFSELTTMVFASHQEEYCWLIEKQFKKYDISANKPAVPDDGTDILKKYKNIWSIVNDDVFFVDYIFMDLSRWNSDRNAMPLQNLFMLVFKRAMGIVFHAKRDEEAPTKRRFFMKGHENDHYKVLPKTLLYSSLDVPPIETLIASETDSDEEFIAMKWTLLFWILHLDFDDDVIRKIRNLPREMTPAVVTVLFLLWERQITPLEGDTIIISENNIVKQPSDADRVEYPTKVDGRTIRISHMYVYARTVISRCFQVCGIDLFNVPVSFDGIHFHNLMNEFVDDAAAFETMKADIKGFQVDEF